MLMRSEITREGGQEAVNLAEADRRGPWEDCSYEKRGCHKPGLSEAMGFIRVVILVH